MYEPRRNIDSYLMREVIESGLSLKLDPNPILFRPIHRKEGHSFLQELKKRKYGLIDLNKTILRNSFLYGCLKFSEAESNEHLIVGYGDRYGGGVDIESYYHIEGDIDSISISAEEVILGQIGSILPNKQLVVFHNHPKNDYSDYLGRPLPSVADRDTLLFQKYLFPIQIMRRFTDGKEGLKFFLGENGKVLEYRTPSISGVLKLLATNNRRY